MKLLHNSFPNPNSDHGFEIMAVSLQEIHLSSMLVYEDPCPANALEIELQEVKDVVQCVCWSLYAKNVCFFGQLDVLEEPLRPVRRSPKGSSRDH